MKHHAAIEVADAPAAFAAVWAKRHAGIGYGGHVTLYLTPADLAKYGTWNGATLTQAAH